MECVRGGSGRWEWGVGVEYVRMCGMGVECEDVWDGSGVWGVRSVYVRVWGVRSM